MKQINIVYFFSIILLSIISINFSINSCQKDYQIKKINSQTNSQSLLSIITPIIGIQKLISEYIQEFKLEDKLDGNEDMLNSIVYSKCGKFFAFIGWGSIIKIWNILDKKLERAIKINDMVHSLCFCPKGQYIATGNFQSDSNISIWELDAKKLEQIDQKEVDQIFGIAFDTGICKKKLNGHSNRSVYSVSYSPCGEFIAFGSDDGIIRIWDLNTNTIIRNINIKDIINCYSKKNKARALSKDVQYIVSAVCYSKDGQSLAFGCVKNVYGSVFLDQPVLLPQPKADYNLRILDLNSEKCVGQFIGHIDRITSISYSNNNQIASSSYDRTVRIWDFKTKECLQILKDSECITSVSFSPCDNFLVASVLKIIKIWKNMGSEVLLSSI